MKRLIIKKLIVISQSESRSLEVPFSKGLNIILGGNKTGKSSIIKSIFYTFGCELKRIEKDWKELISSYLIFFQYGKNQYVIIRQGKKFQIFDQSKGEYLCIIESDEFHNSETPKPLFHWLFLLPKFYFHLYFSVYFVTFSLFSFQ